MKAPAPVPTTRGYTAIFAVIIVVVAAAAADTPELVPLAVVIGLPLVVAPFMARHRAQMALAGLALHSHADPAMAGVGSQVQVRLAVTNRSTGASRTPPLGLLVTDRQWRVRDTAAPVPRGRRWLAPSIVGLVALPTPEPGRTGHSALAVPTRRRGIIELPPQRCWAHDPFGLFGAAGPLTPAVVAVLHPVPADPGASISRASATAGGAGANASGSAGGLGELEGIRPYVPGDRLSLLHWPSKARYDTWFVRQFGGEGATFLPLVIDDRTGVHRRADFDRLTAATLWAVDEALRDGQPVALYTLSGQIASFEPTQQGRADVRLLLARLQPQPAQPSAWSRVDLPADAALFTTRTGAERLTGSGALAQEYDTAHRSVDPSTLPPRLVVI